MLLRQGEDQITWTLTANGIFSVKSIYNVMIINDIGYPHKFMWKARIPQKIKIFLWLTLRNSILTKDNLVRSGWKGSVKCDFCGDVGTVDHLFIFCLFGAYCNVHIVLLRNLNLSRIYLGIGCGVLAKRKRNKL